MTRRAEAETTTGSNNASPPPQPRPAASPSTLDGRLNNERAAFTRGDDPSRAMWRITPAFPDYEASDTGAVRRVDSGRILSQSVGAQGYLRVQLRSSGVRKDSTVHRLVASAFLGAPPPNHQVNHRDGCKTNNHLSNLEYVTARRNIQHAFDLGLNVYPHLRERQGSRFRPFPTGTAHPSAKLDPERVRRIRAEFATGASRKALARKFGVSTDVIRKIIRGEIWKTVTEVPT